MIRSLLALTALAAAAPLPAPAPRAEPVAAAAPVVVEPHDHAGHAHARPRPSRAVQAATARPVAARGATFRTPEAAMRHLAAAYNRHDLLALKRVTTPDARGELEDMRALATDLRLESCQRDGGYYSCTFTHAFPDKPGRGKAWVRVAPATRPGWYMTVLEDCG